MTDQRPTTNADPATTARVIHGAILAGLVIAFAVFIFLQGQVSAPSPDTATILRVIGYFLMVGSILASLMLRGRIGARRGSELGEWWSTALPGAVVVWAVAETGGLIPMVLGWLVGDTTLLALGAAVGLALLYVSRPGRLQSDI